MSPAIRTEIELTNRNFEAAVANRTMHALHQVYTSNARILPPGAAMISGRENIQAFWQSAVDSMNVASVNLQTLDFELTGDTGYEIGQATLHFASGAPSAHAKYVVIWKREDGSWKWHVDIWNPA